MRFTTIGPVRYSKETPRTLARVLTGRVEVFPEVPEDKERNIAYRAAEFEAAPAADKPEEQRMLDIQGVYADSERMKRMGFASITLANDTDWIEQVNHVLPRGQGVYALVEDDPVLGGKQIAMAEEDPSLLDPIMDCDLIFIPGATKPRIGPRDGHELRAKFLGMKVDMDAGTLSERPADDVTDPIVEMQKQIDALTSKIAKLEKK